MNIQIEGNFLPEYSHLVDAFQDAFTKQSSGGASLAIFKDGSPIIDVWAGYSQSDVQWKEGNLALLFSCTKGLLSLMAHRLVEEGLLDLDAPVSKYWPAFAQAGKDKIPVKWVLEHKSGLSAPRADLTFQNMIELDPILTALEEQEPIWEPGTGYAYHALTFGYLVGRVISSITDKSVRDYFQESIAQSLNIPAWIGVPPGADISVAPLIWNGPTWHLPETGDFSSPDYWTTRAMTLGKAIPSLLSTPGEGFNDTRIYQAELGSAGGIMSAYSLAKIYSAAVTTTDGHRFLQDSTIDHLLIPTVEGASVFGEDGPWYRRGCGFMIDNPNYRPFLSSESFGHDGLGGQYAFADRKYRLSFAYLTNFLTDEGDSTSRAIGIVNELRKTFSR
jgi:CubicO group peptidase (beta-lactamase class C family)